MGISRQQALCARCGHFLTVNTSTASHEALLYELQEETSYLNHVTAQYVKASTCTFLTWYHVSYYEVRKKLEEACSSALKRRIVRQAPRTLAALPQGVLPYQSHQTNSTRSCSSSRCVERISSSTSGEITSISLASQCSSMRCRSCGRASSLVQI